MMERCAVHVGEPGEAADQRYRRGENMVQLTCLDGKGV